jgi:predicted DsbA family dithiol-disulfide isomerase
VRLRQVQAELNGRLSIRWRAFPLRPAPDPTATFKGTYREAAWQRCRDLAQDAGVTFRMWERPDFPTWSLPGLEAAKCVAFQSDALFAALHLELYAAFFARGVNIAVPEEVVGVVRTLPGLDVPRFLADYEAGKGRQPVLDDYETAVREDGVRAIPTVIFPDGRRIVGAVSLAEYRRVITAAVAG